MSQYVPAKLAMLMMLVLSFIIYIIMILMQPTHSEYNNIVPSITEAEEVVAESKRSGVVGVLLIGAASVVAIVIVYKVYRAKKSSSVPETEDSAKRNE